MKIFETIIEGFHKVLFADKDSMMKHICLLALTAIISYSSVQSDILNTQLKGTSADAMPDLTGFFLGLLAALIVGCYLWGYSLKFMHNVYHENPEETLPEFDENSFIVFFKALPLMLVWIVYFILIAGSYMAIGFLFVFKMPLLLPLLIIVYLFIFISLAIGLQFVWIEFSKHFNRTGLFNINLPLKYIKPTIGPLCLLGLLYMLIYIICLIPCVLIGAVMGIAGAGETATMYVGGVLGGYLGFVCQLVWYYCIVKLYKEKFENRIE